MNRKMSRSFDPCLGRQISNPFIRFDIFGAAIGITGVVQCIHADEQIKGSQHFCPA